MRNLRRALVALGLLFCWALPAYGAFTAMGVTAGSFSATSLAPPADLTVTHECTSTDVADFTLEWTPTTSTFAEGYVLTRYRDGALEDSSTITPVSTVSETQAGLSAAPAGSQYTWELEAFADAWTSAPASVTFTIPSPTPCGLGLRLQYQHGGSAETSNSITPQIQLLNDGWQPIDLSQLTVRYWFTLEAPAPLEYHCDWAAVGCGNISGAFSKLSPTVAGATDFLELSFGAGAGSIAVGGDTGPIQNRFNKTDWTNFNQADDWSYDGSKGSYADWDRITVYQNGTLVWGVEPSGPGDPAALSVQYRANDTNPSNGTIGPHFKVVNTGLEPVDLSELTLRYWYTHEHPPPAPTFFCDWAQVGCGNITGTITSTGGAGRYLELSFDPGSGIIAGSDSGDIQVRLQRNGNQSFNETNDWSFDPSKTSYAVWDHVTLYRGGTLVWGVEP